VHRFNSLHDIDGLGRGVLKRETGTGRRPLFMPSELRKLDDGRYVLAESGSEFATSARPARRCGLCV
jgi:hypothetical protein